MAVVETSLSVYNKSNYDYLQPDSLPSWIRLNIANRLAFNASQWAKLFIEHRSGTHNNQWMVVDYNKWK